MLPTALGVLAALYGFYVALLFPLQRKALFPGPAQSAPETPPDWVQQMWLRTEAATCEAWFLPPSHGLGPGPALVFAHGNAERIEEWAEPFRDLASLGLGVLLVEYPGYGRSSGVPSQENVTEAFVAAYDALAAREDVEETRIIPVGRSIGGGAACQLLLRREVPAVILMSTFSSIKSLAPRMLYPPFAVRDPFDNLAALQRFSGPVLLLHGRKDMTVPVKHASKLARASNNPTLILRDAGHNDCPPDWSEFRQMVRDFLREHHLLP